MPVMLLCTIKHISVFQLVEVLRLHHSLYVVHWICEQPTAWSCHSSSQKCSLNRCVSWALSISEQPHDILIWIEVYSISWHFPNESWGKTQVESSCSMSSKDVSTRINRTFVFPILHFLLKEYSNVVSRSLHNKRITKARVLTTPVKTPLKRTWLMGIIPLAWVVLFGSRYVMRSLNSSFAPKAREPWTP